VSSQPTCRFTTGTPTSPNSGRWMHTGFVQEVPRANPMSGRLSPGLAGLHRGVPPRGRDVAAEFVGRAPRAVPGGMALDPPPLLQRPQVDHIEPELIDEGRLTVAFAFASSPAIAGARRFRVPGGWPCFVRSAA